MLHAIKRKEVTQIYKFKFKKITLSNQHSIKQKTINLIVNRSWFNFANK